MRRLLTLLAAASLAVIFLPGNAQATHSWNGYHWARTANPFTLQLGDNVDAKWDSYLRTTSADWTQSTVVNTPITTGLAKPRNCRATAGRVEVCNATYGSTGWLGIASVWASGSHITQGTVKVNDTYFNTAKYNTPAWRNVVMCQEVGHTLGLDHQDENFGNADLGTCMDYSNNAEPNQHPNAHDYAMLESIYAHTDSTNTVGSATASASPVTNSRASWGQAVGHSENGRSSMFVRDLGDNQKVFTFVIWA